MTSTAHITESQLLTLARTAGQDAGRDGFRIPDGQSGHVLQFLTDQLVRIGKAQRWRDPAYSASAMISNAYDKGYEETRTAAAPRDERAYMIADQPEPEPDMVEIAIRELRAARGALYCHKCDTETQEGLQLASGYTCRACDTATR
jgi:hypothetical protein